MSSIPRPEYPRMQFRREDSWLNLNGEWRCRFDFGKTGVERNWQEKTDAYDRTILVPFCPESTLSGIGYTDFIESIFYARRFTIPAEWAGKTVLLHFGAVDYAATVWIDGREAGRHQGGSASFTFDITAFARPGVEQTVVVHALDELRSGCQGGGKQSYGPYSAGCHYTRVTGIWQTVWL
ncbi:MAG TPA: beta-glucuronidase, partial [Lentisphaeria bacterium]|nr:beta-glucuronidase [Lentisphaeria bacterium]